MKKKLFNNFVAWIKKPNPDTTLVKLWKRKRARDREKAERERPAKLEKKAEAEYRESIKKEAYLLWEADGKPIDKDDLGQKRIDKIEHKKVISSLLAVAVLGSVIIGYLIYENKHRQWADWTGFGEDITIEQTRQKQDNQGSFTETTKYQGRKTLWDWLELSSSLAVPILLTILGYKFQQRDKEKEKAEQTRRETEQKAEQTRRETEQKAEQKRREDEQKAQAKLEREIAQDNLAEEAIQAYLDNMAKLLLDKELRKELFPNKSKIILGVSIENKEDKDNPVRDVARTQTITILRRLEGDQKRQERIINFLRDAELYGFIFKNANLQSINLSKINLTGANFQEARLEEANFQEAWLGGANLQQAQLGGANLQQAWLMYANLQQAQLGEANLREAKLGDANLREADLGIANLQQAWLKDANLQQASLDAANLQQAWLVDANLQEASLDAANLQEAVLDAANLQEASLGRAKSLTNKQIKSACFWDKAIYKSEWNNVKEPDNTNYIEELKKDTTSNPEEKPSCSIWKQ